MSTTQVQWRRGSSNQNATFVGASGEITIDNDNHRIVVHDSGTVEGWTGARIVDLTTSINNLSGYTNTTITSSGAILSARDTSLSGYITNNNLQDFNNAILYDTLHQKYASIDISNRQLSSPFSRNAPSQNNVIIDWFSGVLIRNSATTTSVSIDWQNYLLYPPVGVSVYPCIDYSNLFLISNNITSIDWGDRFLYDINSNISIDYGNRILSGNWNIESGKFNENIQLRHHNTGKSFTLGNRPFYINTGSLGVTWILPSISNTIDTVYNIKNCGNSITLTGTYPDMIFAQYPVVNFTINSGEAYQLANNGSFWCVM